MSKLNLIVNSTTHTLDVPESRTLAQLLRYDLGLTGTKIGCEEAECGICSVIVEGQTVDSCIYPAFKAQNGSIETIEGIAQNGDLHPLQDAFIEHGAVQCGFCTPGLLMTSAALLENNPQPSEDEIKVALKDTFCRCTGYSSVMRAIRSASQVMCGEPSLAVNEPAVDEPMNSISRSEKVQDVRERVTGRAKYTDDYVFEGMLFALTLRSKYPHARVLSIDTERAKAVPGVRAVLTAADVPGE